MKIGKYRLYSALPSHGVALKWARIDLSRLKSNYQTVLAALSARGKSPRLIAVVKADAYGHGAGECVRALLDEGCDFFAVSCIEEALTVREVCDACAKSADVLILGYTDPALAGELSSKRLIQALLSEEYARSLSEAASAAGVRVLAHAAVNTGMNRIGFGARDARQIEECADALLRTAALPSLSVCGMFTHFARADEEDEMGVQATREQSERYMALRRALEARGLVIPFHHTCNSAATMGGDVEVLDGVRVGILLYGAAPALHRGLPFLPVMRLEARILHIHTVSPGDAIGYGGDYIADSERRIAVIGVGYADGWLRDYRGATVQVHTERGVYSLPLVGRICMDQCMLDVTNTEARVGDVVTLFGETPAQLATLSQLSESIDYEALCIVSSRVLRIYEE